MGESAKGSTEDASDRNKGNQDYFISWSFDR